MSVRSSCNQRQAAATQIAGCILHPESAPCAVRAGQELLRVSWQIRGHVGLAQAR